ncbi:MAG: hypothetical protein KDI60_01675 [Xanthomonadales bacterium]|nr:hypothetical protein [Xanthomonadales bacterium]
MALYYPAEGRNYMMDVAVHGRAQISSWYVLLFEGDYTPQEDDTAANIVARATEITAYVAGTRQALTVDAAVAGATDNADNLAEVTLNANKTVHGFAIVSAAAKGATTGVLLAIQKLATGRAYANGDVIKVPVSLALTNPA